MKDKNIAKAIAKAQEKINEVALDLREDQSGANLSHQADKLDRVHKELDILRTNVHGGGTGDD